MRRTATEKSRRRPRCVQLLCLAASLGPAWLLGPSAAEAAQTGGTGIRIGSGRLHPYLQAESQYVTNPGRIKSGGSDDLVIVARPGLELELPSGMIDLKLKADAEYQQYLDINNANTNELSGFSPHFGATLRINREGALALKLSELLVRDVSPGNQAETSTLKHTTSSTGVGIDYRPGGGALSLSPSYSFFVDVYDSSSFTDPATAKALGNMRHSPRLRVNWKFLPKTAVFFEADTTITRFSSGGSIQNVDSNIIHSYLGLVGAITSKISMLLQVGYGDTLMSGQHEDFRSAIGQLELTYAFSETMNVIAGVLRTVEPVSFFKYFDLIRGYLKFDQLFFGRLQVALGVDYDYMMFGKPTVGDTSFDRVDNNLKGHVSISYQITEWLALALADHIDQRTSNYGTAAGNAGYFHNRATLRLDFRY